jgi:hypothetical protein
VVLSTTQVYHSGLVWALGCALNLISVPNIFLLLFWVCLNHSEIRNGPAICGGFHIEKRNLLFSLLFPELPLYPVRVSFSRFFWKISRIL